MAPATQGTPWTPPPYKMAVARFCFFVAQAFCGAIMTALAGTLWKDCDGQTKFLIIIGIVSSISSTMIAFFDKSMASIADAHKKNVESATNPPFMPPNIP